MDVDIPRGALVAVCGAVARARTSLALDTLYAEGHDATSRASRLIRGNFSIGWISRLRYDLELATALAVTRRGASRSNRSTIGTASETLDYLRLLYSKIAELFLLFMWRAYHAS